jgi:hypothetical protein
MAVEPSGQGVRLLACSLPTKSSRLKPLELRWLAGRKRVAESARLLSATEWEDPVCAAFGCAQEPHLIQPHPIAPQAKKAA